MSTDSETLVLVGDPKLEPGEVQKLEEKRKEYIQEFAFGADGRSSERIVEAILAACKS